MKVFTKIATNMFKDKGFDRTFSCRSGF